MSIPSVYRSILASYASTPDSQNALWNSFLRKSALPSDYVPQDSSKVGDLLMYAQTAIGLQNSIALSPDEITKRKLMLDTFIEILRMLSTLQDTVAAQAKLLVFYQKWQQEYTQKISRTVLYTATPTTTMQVNTADTSKFTFGYNNISADDIGSYLAANRVTGSRFDMATPTIDDGQGGTWSLALGAAYLSPTQGDLSLQFLYTKDSVTTSFEIGHIPLNFNGQTSEEIKSDWASGIAQILTQSSYRGDDGLGAGSLISVNGKFNSATNSYLFNLTKLTRNSAGQITDRTDIQGKTILGFTVPWNKDFYSTFPFSTTDTTQLTAISNATGRRDENNALLQQYIQNMTSKRQTIQSASQQMSSTLSQSQNAVSQLSDLLTNFMQTLEGLVSAIAR